MVNRSESDPTVHQALSCLMDGELTQAETADALAGWGEDGDMRARWHAYHLIGDVLRSDELASQPAADERFLQALRLRLADEPVPMSPAPLPMAAALVAGQARPAGVGAQAEPSPQRRPVRHWLAPAALAAGLMAALALTLVPQWVTPASMGPTLATTPVQAPGKLVRDARLDRYLAAHRGQASSALAAGAAEHRVQIVFEAR